MPDNQITLVENGQLLFRIHRLPWQAAEEIIEAADELIRCLQTSFGQPIPQAEPGVDQSEPVSLVIHLDPLAKLTREAFEIDAAANRIVLRGRTPEAISHAVYWFLETSIGARWLWPGELGEVIPRHQNLSFPTGKQSHQPDYDWRRIGTAGPIYRAMDYNTMLHSVLGLPLSYQRDFDLWCRRNRFGGPKIADGHRWAQMAPAEEFGQKRAELFATAEGKRDNEPHDGKHGNQPCLANPEVTDLMADYACAAFDAQRDIDAYSLGLNDGGFISYCECPQCLEIDRQAGSQDIMSVEHFDQTTDESGVTDRKPERSITDRVIWQANQVINKVAQRYPDRRLFILLYSQFRRPPVKHQLDERIIGQYCVQAHAFWHPQAKKTELDRIREMSKSIPSLGIYEYYSQGAWSEAHRLFPTLVESSVRAYHQAGARYFATQPSTGFAANGINFYVLGRCLWDVSTSAETVIEDYCRSGFGRGGDQIRQYLMAFASRWEETVSGSQLPSTPLDYLNVAHLYPAEFLAQRQAELNEARRLTAKDKAIQARIGFLQQGLDFTQYLADGCRLALELYEIGGGDEHGLPTAPTDGTNNQFNEVAGRAHQAWERFWHFVAESQGQYVHGEFWTNYRWFKPGLGGEKHPLRARLRELAQAAVAN